MLATTLLDHHLAPAAELAAVSHGGRSRMHDEVKTHILGPGAALRSKTPDLGTRRRSCLLIMQQA